MANPGIVIVSPLFPPARGGVADHSYGLAEKLALESSVTLFTSKGAGAQPHFRVIDAVESWSCADPWTNRLLEIASGNTVLWQYVPHMYGRGGVNPGLARCFSKIQQRGIRQLLLAHEIAAPWSIWPHRMLYASAQRRQWEAILRTIDSIGISTGAWLELWKRRRPEASSKFWLAPSPATVPLAPCSDEQCHAYRHRLGFSPAIPLLGFFGDGSAPKQISWLFDCWKAAGAAGGRAGLVVAGCHPDFSISQADSKLYRPLGYVPAAEASLMLQTIDLLSLPYLDGVSERRTTFMAGLSHGCPVLTTIGSNTGAMLRGADFFAATQAVDSREFVRQCSSLLADRDRRRALGRAGKSAYAREFDWGVLVDRILGQL